MVSRRTFILTGAAGAAALATAYWFGRRGPGTYAVAPLDAPARAIVSAIVPAMLGPALPDEAGARLAAVDRTTAGVAAAIAGLPPAAQHELAELFALLDWLPGRRLVAGFASPWAEADLATVETALERWRTSRLDLLRSAYDALHQLVFAAWYGDPASWAGIGYPGPPAIRR